MSLYSLLILSHRAGRTEGADELGERRKSRYYCKENTGVKTDGNILPQILGSLRVLLFPTVKGHSGVCGGSVPR